MRKKDTVIFGVGRNDIEGTVNPTINGKRVPCKYYGVWHTMLQRCYSKKAQERHPAYIGCTVAKEWHSFKAFKEWMQKQDWKGKQIDKDILVAGNRVYSPATCIFVDGRINKLLTNRKALRGKYPQGVSYHPAKGKYIAKVQMVKVHKEIGAYDTPDKAFQAYKIAKAKIIMDVALQQDDARLRAGLIARAADIYYMES